MIYTLTANPAIDMNVSADALSSREINRTRDAVYTPNGKGLNVAFTLTHFGIPAHILGFFGGFSGAYIVEEACKICPVTSVPVEGITRINLFITTPEGELKFPNAGAPVNLEAQEHMIEVLESVEDLDALIVSGSLPPGVESSFLVRVASVLAERGKSLVLDISSNALKELLPFKPLLIKPNDEELKDIFDWDIVDEQSALEACLRLHELGAQNILLTQGDREAYFFNGQEAYKARPLAVEMYSSACAGDGTLAAFFSRWFFDHSQVEAALRRAMATGANVAMSAGLGDFARVEEFESRIEIQRCDLAGLKP